MATLIEAMLAAGFGVERADKARRMVTRWIRADFVNVMGEPAVDAFDVAASVAISRFGGEIAFQVHVTTRSSVHLVDVLARGEAEAITVASQIVACRDLTPIAAHVVTDSTLTPF